MRPDDLLGALLRGDACAWPWPLGDAAAARAFLADVSEQHVEPLVAWHLKHRGLSAAWPESVVCDLGRSLREQTAREAIRERELAAVLAALGRAGAQVLLIKGSALAYTIYPAPALRQRGDTDLLVRLADLDRVEAVLSERGYRRGNYLVGARVSHQALFQKVDAHGVVHELDVHWKISNRPLFEDTLGWDELDAAAMPVPALGASARALGPVHALVLACVHPTAHHGDARPHRLRWLYDVHLLAGIMTAPDTERWLALVRARGICAICHRALVQAQEHFGTDVPRHVMDALGSARNEPSAEYLSSRPWRGDVRLSDLRTTPGIRGKVQLVREVVIPTKAYMQEAYGVSGRFLLAPLYAYRVVRGSWRLLWRLVG